MREYFWAYYTEIPPSLYTRNFSLTHLIWLTSVFLIIGLSLPVYRRVSATTQIGIKKGLVMLLVLCEIGIWIWQGVIGHYTLRNSLPLHLCSVSVFVEFAAVFFKRNLLLKEFTYALSMPGAYLALITPGWYYPLSSFSYLTSVLSHSILFYIPLLFVLGDKFKPDFRRLPKCFLLLLLFSAGAYIANQIFGGNYMFLRFVPPETPLKLFETWFGNPGYLLPVILLILLIWVILYLPFSDKEKRRR